MSEQKRIALGFDEAAKTVGVSKRVLQYATQGKLSEKSEPDPSKRLKTVRLGGRRLIRPADLEDWFARVSVEETQAA